MELWDIYDKNRVKTGKTMVRGNPFLDGAYHLIVQICIFNAQGKMLIQQRSPQKKSGANLWTITAGGSAITGETSASAAQSCLKSDINGFSNRRPYQYQL
ncbi:MAG: NUDIX domain-containing protein [Emergencia sp.]